MRISDWSSDVCSSDLVGEDVSHELRPPELGRPRRLFLRLRQARAAHRQWQRASRSRPLYLEGIFRPGVGKGLHQDVASSRAGQRRAQAGRLDEVRSEEHTYEIQSLMLISYAIFCLKTK